MNLFANNAVGRIRIARPTDRLADLERFYHEILGLPRITAWQDGIDGDHQGYDGLILGMPDGSCHLEFTHHRDGSPAPIPSRDSLLVFYFPARDRLDEVVARFRTYRHQEVAPENPWWTNDGHTFEDPDGWRVVLMLGRGVSAPPRAFEDRDQSHD